MKYCNVQDLEGYFLNKSFKCGDYLSSNKAMEFIIADSAFIDASLRAKYNLPITDTDDLIILKTLCEKMVVGTIDDIFREKTEDGKFERGRNTRKDALDFLKMIKDGDIILNSSQETSVIKFNTITSDDVEVSKRFKDSNIDTY